MAMRHLGRACLLPALLGLTACAIYGHQLRSMDNALQAGGPQSALAILEELGHDKENEVLYLINKASLLRMQGDIRGSIAAFEAAKPLMDFQEATSVSETIKQFSVVEGASSYQPRPYERLQLHALQAMNYLEIGDLDAARVEALQIDLLIDRLYGGEAPHGGDAFPLYLSGIIFELNREPDSALVAYRKALAAYGSGDMGTGIPTDLKRRMLLLTDELGLESEFEQLRERFPDVLLPASRPAPDDEIIVIAGTGLVPQRIEVSSLHQSLEDGKMYRISLPSLVSRDSRIARVVAFDGAGEEQAADLVSDLEPPARATLDEEMPALIARAIARNLVKNRVANEVGEQSQGMELFVNFLAAAIENADLRSWSTLSSQQFLLRLPRSSIAEQVTIELRDSGGRPLQTEAINLAGLPAGEPVVRSLYAVRP